MTDGKPLGIGISPGAYMLKVVAAEDGTFYQRIFPLPEVQELDDLRREVRELRAKQGVNALTACAIALRYGLKISSQGARLLAFMFVNAPRFTKRSELESVLYGHRADGGPVTADKVVIVTIHGLRKALGGKHYIEHLPTFGFRLAEVGVQKCREIIQADGA